MPKPSDRDLVFQALHDAIGWQLGLADAYEHVKDSPERVEALEQVKAYRSLLRRRYGSDMTAIDRMAAEAKSVPIHQVLKDMLPKSEGEG